MWSFLFPNSKKKDSIKPLVLLVLDGFGIAPPSKGNAIYLAKTPNIDWYKKVYPGTELIASGESVGLPANEVGNTEVGHLTMGSGRVIFQDLKRINVAIETGSFYDNKAFLQAAGFVKTHNSKLHIMGLVGSGNVHSSVEHIFALLQFCKKESIQNLFLHLFTDGRDSPPNEGVEIIRNIERRIDLVKIGKIATVSGRYYAMDRDRRWNRTEKAYKAIVSGEGIFATSAEEAIEKSYKEGKTDEFIEPTVIVQGSNSTPIATVDDNDSVVFANFRIDRAKQMTMAFVLPDFEKLKSFDFGYNSETSRVEGEIQFDATFSRVKPPKVFFVTMTEYDENLPVSAIAFGPEAVSTPLAKVLSEVGFKQLHLAESEKERFVTYYFDGMRETLVEGEDKLIVPSPKVATYDLKPEMSLPKLVAQFKRELSKNYYKFFCLNFANPDMVAHSGNLKATIAAIEIVDKYVKELVEAVLAVDGTVFITADHGNAEELITFPASSFFYTSDAGTVNTDHSNNPVPFLAITNRFQNQPKVLAKGGLSDVAPTILAYLGLQIPKEMTGKNLFGDNKSPETVKVDETNLQKNSNI